MPPSSDHPALHAWADESIRDQQCLYLLGAVVARPHECDEHRRRMRAVHTQGVKLHWHELVDPVRSRETAKRRRVVETVAGLGCEHLVVVAMRINPRKPERARYQCLQYLGWELAARGVDRLTLESRKDIQNQRDLERVRQLRNAHQFPQDLRVYHGQPSQEPMLWVPDQVLGAIGAAELGDPQYTQILGEQVRRLDFEP